MINHTAPKGRRSSPVETMQDAAAAHSANGNATASFFCAATGVYASTHPPVHLPDDPSLSLVAHLFARLPRTGPRAPALVDAATSESISRADLRRLVSSLAAGLNRRLGLRAGDVVLLVLPNSVIFPVTFLAVLAAGGVAVPMSTSSAPAEIAARVRETSPAIVLSAREHVGKIPPLGVPVVLVPESFGRGEDGEPEFAPFRALLDSGEATAPAVGQDDAAAILYSSGTSGRSKGAVLTHRNLIATVELFVRFEASQYAQPACDNVYLAVLPMFHVYGLSLFALGLLSLGSTVVVMKRFDAAEAINAINRYNVTHFPIVPPIMAALVSAATSPAGLPLDSLVQVSSGAAPLSGKLIHDFVKAFPHVDFIQGYGMTESAAVGTRGFNTPKQRKYASVGLLAPNMHARIVDQESGCYLPPGSCGELWLHGPAIMKGYLNIEDSCLGIGGWLRTGDIAYFDSDGYLYIVGRLKDVIKYKGFQIAPADLEAVMTQHPEILDVAVTSAEDEEVGEIPVAFVVRKAGSSLSCMQVMEHVANQVSPYKKVRKVIFVDSIPRSAAGKVLRRLLKESLIGDSVASAGGSKSSSRRSRL